MSAVDEVLAEYVRMRQNGLDAKEALRALRSYVESFTKEDKEDLAAQLRHWEKDHALVPDASQPKKSSVIKPIKPVQAAANDAGGTMWVECRHCGRKNRAADVFCYACGQLLDLGATEQATRHFADATERLFSDEFFGSDSVLVLTVRDTGLSYELRPQLRQHELVIGRSADNSAMRPDVDLNDADGANLGVSRLHLALRYETSDNTIQVYDLGSANGSFINGQKLHPKELRLLRNHDELRLGRLILTIQYFHPGEELRPS
jgi:hypothetical protein